MASYIEDAKALGYSDEQLNNWLAPWMAQARDAGYSQDQINQHLGIKAPPEFDGGKLIQVGEKGLAAPPKPVTSFSDALEAGWQLSTVGLLAYGKMPTKQVAEDAPMASRIAGQVATLTGDVPAMMAGYGIAQAGAQGGGVIGGVLGTGAAMALPTVLRETLMDSYQHGEFKNFSDFWDRASGIMINTAKSWVVGAATGVAGAAAKIGTEAAGAVAPWLASPAMSAATKTAAEVTTMTTVGAALEGHVPKAQDFLDAAILLGGLKFAEVGAGKLRTLYAQKGITPQAVITDAAKDPTVQQDLLSSSKEIPSLYEIPEGMSESEASGRMLAAARETNRSATSAEPGAGAPISVSRGNVRGEAPIVRFRNDATAIETSLPEPAEGFTRLWRGNRPGEVGSARQFTNDLPGIALPFREGYGGNISYVDVPTSDAAKYLNKTGGAPGAEFFVPRDVASGAREVPVEPASNASPYETVPKEPQRLVPFLQGGVTINKGAAAERTAQFGLRDEGGDISAIVGGPKGRPGLINNMSGERLDDAGLRAYEAGYFDHRPDINELLTAIEKDHNGNPVYSNRDQAAVEAHQQAMGSNAEIVRLASDYGISERGKTREQFFDDLTNHLSQEQIAAEQAKLEPAHEAAYAEFERASQAAGVRPETTSRSLEDLEREYQQETVARTASQRDAGNAQPGTAGPGAVSGEGGGGPVGRAAGDAGRAGTETGTATRAEPGRDASGVTGELPLAGGGRPPPPPPPVQEALPLPPGGKPVRNIAEAQATILDHVSVNEKPATRGWSLARLYTDTIDRLYPIWTAADNARATLGINDMPANLDPGKLSRLYAGAPGVATRFLNFDTIDFRTREPNGPGLKQVLAPVANDLDAFRAYISSRHAIDLEANGIKTGFNLDAARMVVDAGAEKFAPIQQALTDYSNRAAAYARDAGVISQAGYDAMVEKRAFYVPFQRVMDPDFSKPSRGSGGGTLQATSPLRSIEGSERVVIDPIESVIRNTFLMTQMAERNNVGNALVDLLHRAEGKEITETAAETQPLNATLVQAMREVGITDPEQVRGLTGLADMATPVAEGQIRVMRDGKPRTFDVDPELARSFKALDQDTANWLVRVLALPARALRAGAVLTPDFMARNLLRDLTTAFINTGKGVFSPVDSMRGLVGVLRKDADYQRWMSEGGASASMVSLDRSYLQENLRALTSETGLGTRAWNVIRHPIDALRAVSEVTEEATRLGEFKGVYDKMIKDGMSPEQAGREAAFSSRELTLDFSRMGAKMKSTNMLIAFFNAQLQGVDRTVRSMIDRPVSTAARIAIGVTMPSALLWWANKDDERVQDLPQWQRDLFWIIATDKWEAATPDKAAGLPAYMTRTVDGQLQINNGHLFRLPKPFETGILFGTSVERTLDAYLKAKPEAFKGLAGSVAGGFLPSFTPTFALPLLEQFANRSTFTGRTLVPDQMEKYLPEYQYTPYTTETAKAIGQALGAFPGIKDQKVEDGVLGAVSRSISSPILMENYLRAWSGNLGVYVLAAADKGLREAGLLPDPPKPESTLADIPFVKAFVVRYPTASAQSIQDFSDEYKKNKTYFDTYMAMAKEGNLDAMDRITKAGGQMMFVQLNGIHQALAEHSKIIRDVYKNPDITPAEKRQLIDTAYWRMSELAKSGTDTMRAVKRALPESVGAR